MLPVQVALKCADVGHLAAPWDVHLRWVSGLEEEFFRQVCVCARAHTPPCPFARRDVHPLPAHAYAAPPPLKCSYCVYVLVCGCVCVSTMQGDREKAAHLTVSPLMDRTKDGITKSQVRTAATSAEPERPSQPPLLQWATQGSDRARSALLRA